MDYRKLRIKMEVERQARLRDAGLCIRCQKPRDEDQSNNYCAGCLRKRNRWRRKRDLTRRESAA